ncbi:MAG TPA: lysylphosphatidylglycerol synthase transmembrane domain-containing protein [Mycobacteriales bacterium]|nr:lysylphosphatidylglycerol synthase transmembrane domain-containing protein [Mycobacteriales bacterium]
MTPRFRHLKRFRRSIRVLLVAISVILCVGVVATKRHEVGAALRQLDPAIVVLAFVLVLGATVMMMLSWRVLLRDLGSPLAIRPSARVFFLAQLGKYIPGSVWPLLAQVELGREHGVPGRRSGVVGVIAMIVSLLAALLVAAVTLPLFSPVAAHRYWWVFVTVPFLLALLHPRLFNPMLARVFRLARREPPDSRLTGRGLGLSLCWSIAAWIAYGAQVWLLVRDLGVTAPRAVPLAIGSFALAWAVGFLVVIAPAGAGAREAALTVGLAPVLQPGAALLVALISRILLTGADLLLAVLAVSSERRRRRSTEVRSI